MRHHIDKKASRHQDLTITKSLPQHRDDYKRLMQHFVTRMRQQNHNNYNKRGKERKVSSQKGTLSRTAPHTLSLSSIIILMDFKGKTEKGVCPYRVSVW